MSDNLNIENETAKKARQAQTLRKIWLVLIPFFVLVVLFTLYNWSTGKSDLTGIFSPLGMICVGLASAFFNNNKTAKYIFLALGLIFVFIGLGLAIFY